MELTPLQRDALREIGEMSAGAAAAAIAKLIGQRTTHVTSQLHEVPARELAQALGVSGHGIAGSAVKLEGDLRGALLLAFQEPVARAVAARMQGKSVNATSPFGPLEQSAIKELANITTGTYLKTFYNFLGFDMDFGVAAIAKAAWEPLVKYTFLGTTPGAETVWAVASVLDLGLDGPGRLFLLLDAKGLQRVLQGIERRLRT